MSADRVCGDDAPWTATVTARSDRDWNKNWRSRHSVQGTTSGWSPVTDDQVPYVVEIGPFDATVAAVTVVVDSQWFIKSSGDRSGSGTRQAEVSRPAATECPTTPNTPAATYDCDTDTITIIGADDTDSVDYTTTINDPADGEGDTWSITITAQPQPGYEFPPDTTTTWTFTGTVDCLDTTTATAPAVVCDNDALAIDAPVSDRYTYTIDGDLSVPEGAAYSITVTATPTEGYEFAPGAVSSWTFTGVVDCIDEEQAAGTSTTTTTTTTTPTGSSGTATTTVASELPRTGSSSTSIFLAYASLLVLTGGMLQLVRRTGRPARVNS